MSTLAGSRILVIGGASGIGRAVAASAAALGAEVTIASRSPERAASELGVADRRLDVTDPGSVAALVEDLGTIDHLVFTAGDELVQTTLADYRPEAAAAFFEVRLFRMLDVLRAFVPIVAPTGSIVLTSTTSAMRGGRGRVLASSLGAAIIAAARSLAVELAPIRVNVVAPGVVRTGLWHRMPVADRERLFDAVGAASLTGRVSDPEDVAPAYLRFLEMDQVTGDVASVDGGATLA